jgi:hypothetical protein
MTVRTSRIHPAFFSERNRRPSSLVGLTESAHPVQFVPLHVPSDLPRYRLSELLRAHPELRGVMSRLGS